MSVGGHIRVGAAQTVVVEVRALLGQPGRRFLSVEEDEADLAHPGAARKPRQRARRLDDHGGAVVGAHEPLWLGERVVVRADHDRGAPPGDRPDDVAQPRARPEATRSAPSAAAGGGAARAAAAGASRGLLPNADLALDESPRAIGVEPIHARG
jgi:hypothetical protein